MYKSVMDTIGRPVVFSVCMLGAVIGLVWPESVMKVLETRIPAGFIGMNRQALDLDMKPGEPYKR